MQVTVLGLTELLHCVGKLIACANVAVLGRLAMKPEHPTQENSFKPPVSFVIWVECFDDEDFSEILHDVKRRSDQPLAATCPRRPTCYMARPRSSLNQPLTFQHASNLFEHGRDVAAWKPDLP